ncbi:MAG: TVP38/TMEM64 family protein [Rhodospirillales bacterium]|nr:MAG: TVP38/TMEM64 family protein [Rhodospirillales bacterium]
MTETRKSGKHGKEHTLSIRRLIPVAIIAIGFVAFFALGGDEYLSFEVLKDNRRSLLDWRADNELVAALAFMALYVLLTAFSVPGGVWMTIGGGFLFGTLFATAYVVVGATIGATLVFLAARYAFADYLRSKAGPAMRKMEAGFRENALNYLLFLRLIPVFPFWLVNLVPAFLGVRVTTYVLATLFGIIPGAFVYASVGNGIGAVIDAGEEPDLGIIFEPAILIPIVGLGLLALLPVIYKWIKGKPPSEAVNDQP